MATNNSRRGKRKAPSDADEPVRDFAALRPRTRLVSEAIVRRRWTKLPENTQTTVREVLRAGERPAIMRIRDEKSRLDAQQDLDPVRRRLYNRVPKIPFPPGTKDVHFDYESVIGLNRDIEAQLTSVLHYNELLRAEVAKREVLLSQEQVELQSVERNAKAVESSRRKQIRKVHPLLKNSESVNIDNEVAMIYRIEPSICLDDDSDLVLQGFAKQLTSHLESLQANASQMTDVNIALASLKPLLSRISGPKSQVTRAES